MGNYRATNATTFSRAPGVEVAPYKKDAADFVLWKPSHDGQPGWDSPWGFGRPGWHLECSAMSSEYLGLTFDIHGGGQDLIFPHHENEIAQSRCAHPDEEFARFWLHNGYLMVEGEKMSKSLGNFITIRDLLANHHGETIRLAMLKTHYRSPLDWTENGLREAKTELDRFYGALRGIESDGAEVPAALVDALGDDLNSPQALAALHEIAGELNRAASDDETSACAARLRGGGELFGLLQLDPEEWFRWAAGRIKWRHRGRRYRSVDRGPKQRACRQGLCHVRPPPRRARRRRRPP